MKIQKVMKLKIGDSLLQLAMLINSKIKWSFLNSRADIYTLTTWRAEDNLWCLAMQIILEIRWVFLKLNKADFTILTTIWCSVIRVWYLNWQHTWIRRIWTKSIKVTWISKQSRLNARDKNKPLPKKLAQNLRWGLYPSQIQTVKGLTKESNKMNSTETSWTPKRRKTDSRLRNK